MEESSTNENNLINNAKPKSNIFQCKVCPYNTLRRPFLDKHMQQKHGFSKVKPDSPVVKKRAHGDMEKNIKRKRIEQSTESSEGNDELEFGCELCDFKTKHDVLLNMHLEIHETEEGEMYQCTQCDFKTVEVSALRTHERTHKKLKLFQCPNCDYASRHKCNFKVHIKTHEDPAKLETYECKFCDNFNSYHKSSLYKHISLKHKESTNIFQCEDCSYATPNKALLAKHSLIHRNDLPMHHCEICDFETHNEVTIRKHVKMHEERKERGEEELIVKEIDGITQLVWFCCDLCEFRSKDQRYVILHKKVHARADEINRKGEEIVYGKGKEMESSTENNDDNEDNS